MDITGLSKLFLYLSKLLLIKPFGRSKVYLGLSRLIFLGLSFLYFSGLVRLYPLDLDLLLLYFFSAFLHLGICGFIYILYLIPEVFELSTFKFPYEI
jgi:hypothetical protein